MRHRVFGRKLGRDVKARKALFKNLINALIEHREIKTTKAKAKAIKEYAERVFQRESFQASLSDAERELMEGHL